jgi:glycerol-3-phosphate dehydrogenase (NAD(P)+)
VTILGAGAWGAALAQLAQANAHRVRLWSRRGEIRLEAALQEVEILISAVSMQGVPATVDRVQALGLPASTVIVTATKGLDAATTHTPSQIWQAAFPTHPVVVLSGPNLSQEIQRGLPAATVVACQDLSAAAQIQQLLSSETFRVYTSPDPVGAELGGTLKNVMAIAAGVCDGLHLGTNAKSGLVTRALAELVRVGTHLGGQLETFFGLSGLGDMLATCSSPLSRNYQVGYGLAQGRSLDEILSTLQGTAEGINTTDVLIAIAEREGIAVPIARQVYALLHHLTTPEKALLALMERDLKPEVYSTSTMVNQDHSGDRQA